MTNKYFPVCCAIFVLAFGISVKAVAHQIFHKAPKWFDKGYKLQFIDGYEEAQEYFRPPKRRNHPGGVLIGYAQGLSSPFALEQRLRGDYAVFQAKYTNCINDLVEDSYFKSRPVRESDLLARCYYNIEYYMQPDELFPDIMPRESTGASDLLGVFIHMNLPSFQMAAGTWTEAWPLIVQAIREHEALEAEEARAEQAAAETKADYIDSEIKRLKDAGLLPESPQGLLKK